jgi:hypothetical protein
MAAADPEGDGGDPAERPGCRQLRFHGIHRQPTTLVASAVHRLRCVS